MGEDLRWRSRRGRRGVIGVGPPESESCESGGLLFFRRLAIDRRYAPNPRVLSASPVLFILRFDDLATTIFIGKGKRGLSALGA